MEKDYIHKSSKVIPQKRNKWQTIHNTSFIITERGRFEVHKYGGSWAAKLPQGITKYGFRTRKEAKKYCRKNLG